MPRRKRRDSDEWDALLRQTAPGQPIDPDHVPEPTPSPIPTGFRGLAEILMELRDGELNRLVKEIMLACDARMDRKIEQLAAAMETEIQFSLKQHVEAHHGEQTARVAELCEAIDRLVEIKTQKGSA